MYYFLRLGKHIELYNSYYQYVGVPMSNTLENVTLIDIIID